VVTAGLRVIEGPKDILSADAVKMRQTTDEYFKFGRGLKSYIVKLKSPKLGAPIIERSEGGTEKQRLEVQALNDL
jgi:hypothetical protein